MDRNTDPNPDTMRTMNEALVLGSLRQHELAEAAALLNEQLQSEIAERKQMEESLRESEERYRTLFELGPVAAYSCDDAGVIESFNRRAVELWGRMPTLGDTDERFCGSFRMYSPDGCFLPHDQCPMAKVISGEIAEVHDAEVVIERPDTTRVTAVVNIRPVKNQRGEITGAINCFYDITERSRLEHETQVQASALEDLHQRKDEFLAMLSHELRNPLAPILNAVHILRLNKGEDVIQKQARTIIERQVGQLKRLIDDLLEVSRITTGRVQLRRERIGIGGVIEAAIETALPLITQRRHNLELSLPSEPIWLHADAARLEQVVVNLLTNAAKYTNEGGRISLKAERQDDRVALRVRDSGIGIAPELLPHIFEIFSQADHSLDRAMGGLGLGLCLVQRLVELHEGSVEAFSAVGEGSEFVVYLPAEQGPADDSLPLETEIEASTEQCRQILVVEDNVDTANSLALLLRSSGHTVRVAHEGRRAVEEAVADIPDVVLLDIGLPGISGYEVAKRIRGQTQLRDVVLIAMTGYGLDQDLEKARNAGFNHRLVKPVDFRVLQTVLASLPEKPRPDVYQRSPRNL